MRNIFVLLFIFAIFFIILIIYYICVDSKNDYKYLSYFAPKQSFDNFIKGKGLSLSNFEENLQIINSSDLLNGDLGFKVSNKINKNRENDQFYFKPFNCVNGVSLGLNCAKSFNGQEFAEGWFL